eukprot:500460_1
MASESDLKPKLQEHQRYFDLLKNDKEELIKMCKEKNLNTDGCFVKIDYVKLFLGIERVATEEKSNANKKQKVVICGGGNAAHVFLGLAATNENNDCYLFSLFKTEAADFKTKLTANDNKLIVERTQKKTKTEATINPDNIGNDPACLKGADIVVISLPAFAHAQYLKAIAPNVGDKPCLVGVFPGACGLECDWQAIICDKKSCEFGAKYKLLSCTTLPWAARIKEFGQSVEILGTKDSAPISIYPKYDKATAQLLSDIIGELPVLDDYGHIISMTLGALNAIVHPSVLYGKWVDWDGKPVDEKPLFYQGITKKDAELLMALSDEMIVIANVIKKEAGIDSLVVTQVYDVYKTAYGANCTDTETLYGLITTNPAYNGLVHPMKEHKPKDDEKASDKVQYVPNFEYRYLSEDIPMGLAVIKGIALILKEVPKTPVLDKIIQWSQKVMEKEYLVYADDGKVTPGKNIDETRAPQKYGFDKIQQLL